jgi:hypothetical protein
MKLLIAIIVGTSIILLGLTPVFGISWLESKTHSVNRWTYIFLDRYIYDYAGLYLNHERVNRLSGYRHPNDRWYYHYGQKLKPYNKQRYYQDRGYIGKARVYSQPQYPPQNYGHRKPIKPIQMRDRIPRNNFRYRSPFPRAR